MCRGITHRYRNCYMSASVQLLRGSCIYNFLSAENSVSSELLEDLNVVNKKINRKTVLFHLILKWNLEVHPSKEMF